MESQRISIQIVNKSNNPNPNYQTNGSAGCDLMAFLEESIILKPMERILIPTGLFIELPNGFEAQVRPRSGLALKHGITILNSPGTIDSDYRGEIKVLIINLSLEQFEVKSGDRIAQMVISKHENVQFIDTINLSSTFRGEGGYGSTGI